MAQNDFRFLTLSEHSDEQKPDCMLDCPLTSEPRTCCADDDYVPVNFIPEEVRAMIKAWQLADQKRRELQEASPEMSVDVPADSITASQDVFEPMRCIPNAAPPKRFYRTFWRSITRKVLEHDKEIIFAQQKAAKTGFGEK